MQDADCNCEYHFYVDEQIVSFYNMQTGKKYAGFGVHQSRSLILGLDCTVSCKGSYTKNVVQRKIYSETGSTRFYCENAKCLVSPQFLKR